MNTIDTTGVTTEQPAETVEEGIAPAPYSSPGDEIGPLADRLVRDMMGGHHWYCSAMGLRNGPIVEADEVELARSIPASRATWRDLGILSHDDPDESMSKWEAIKEAARQELRSGHRASMVLESDTATPMDRARFLAIREALAEEWQPRGGIEWSLLDQMAQAQAQQFYWTDMLTRRSQEQAARDGKDRDEIVKARHEGRDRGMYCGTWIAPRISEAEAIQEAAAMVDRWNRMYLRVLRQLRDLRRYSPQTPSMIVNNGGQVNVAANGGQQVNGQLNRRE